MSYKLTTDKFLTIEQTEQLENSLSKLKQIARQTLKKRKSRTAFRNITMIQLSMNTGARASEILSIEKKFLNEDNQSVYIRGNKGSRDREIPLPGWLFEDLNSLSVDGDGRLFPITYKNFFKIWSEYKTCNKKLHALRHTFGINLYRKCKDIKTVQHALGHKNIKNTFIYLEFNSGFDELKKVLLA